MSGRRSSPSSSYSLNHLRGFLMCYSFQIHGRSSSSLFWRLVRSWSDMARGDFMAILLVYCPCAKFLVIQRRLVLVAIWLCFRFWVLGGGLDFTSDLKFGSLLSGLFDGEALLGIIEGPTPFTSFFSQTFPFACVLACLLGTQIEEIVAVFFPQACGSSGHNTISWC